MRQFQMIYNLTQRYYLHYFDQDITERLAYLKTSYGLQDTPGFSEALMFSVRELQCWLTKPKDEEDHAIYLGIWLWKQRHGKIDLCAPRVPFEDWSLEVDLARTMIRLGYPNILTETRAMGLGITTSFSQEIQRCIQYVKAGQLQDDGNEYYLDYLVTLLNMTGTDHGINSDAQTVLNFLQTHSQSEHIDVSAKALAILLFDTGAESEPCKASLLSKLEGSGLTPNNFLAWCIASKMGETIPAQEEDTHRFLKTLTPSLLL